MMFFRSRCWAKLARSSERERHGDCLGHCYLRSRLAWVQSLATISSCCSSCKSDGRYSTSLNTDIIVHVWSWESFLFLSPFWLHYTLQQILFRFMSTLSLSWQCSGNSKSFETPCCELEKSDKVTRDNGFLRDYRLWRFNVLMIALTRGACDE